MNPVIMELAVIFPILTGALIPVLPFKSRKQMCIYIEAVTIMTSIMVFTMLLNWPEGSITVFRFTGNLSVSFKLDGLGAVFAGMVSFLWPLAVLYSFEYMKHEGHEKTFFMFYIITYGVTLGAALSENIITMYFFFEMLSLITLPLIMHTLTKEAIHASRTYLYNMIGGAAFAFIGVVFILMYGTTSSFLPGGVMDMAKVGDKVNVILFVYILCFCGFGIKTAMWPFSSWLPKAGVAPTPVTALLHAVAVVKTGAFAVMRITYYSFGADFLRGTWAQSIILVLIIITIVYGCSRAVKETHIKRRLAWSTVSNLSYILFGVALMTPAGLLGALCHMVIHAFMKICSFFCAGSIIYKTGSEYVHELDGYGRKMPKVFIIFTISGMALMGVPGLPGFVSKWFLVKAALNSESTLGLVGIGALLISALLTATYMLTISVRAFFPEKNFDYGTIEKVQDPNWMMILPLSIFVVVIVVLGVHSAPLVQMLEKVVSVL